MSKSYYVYILTNTWHTVFYTGVTNDLIRRVYEHKMKLIKGFTEKYNLCKLVYFEEAGDIEAAIHREKIIKKWKHEFKFDAIHRMNPQWKDLYIEMVGEQNCHAAVISASSSKYEETPQQVRGDSLAVQDEII